MDILATLGLAVVLAYLARTDMRDFRLPDIATLPLLVAGFAVTLLTGRIAMADSLLGAALGFGVFWIIGAVFFRYRGHEGLGLGDAKLFAASGSWLGYAMLPYVLLIAAVGALLFAGLFRRDSSAQIAFGPWLAAGFMAMWLVALARAAP